MPAIWLQDSGPDGVEDDVVAAAEDDVVVDNTTEDGIMVDRAGRDATTAISWLSSLMKPLNPSYKVHSVPKLSKVTARQFRLNAHKSMHCVKLRS